MNYPHVVFSGIIAKFSLLTSPAVSSTWASVMHETESLVLQLLLLLCVNQRGIEFELSVYSFLRCNSKVFPPYFSAIFSTCVFVRDNAPASPKPAVRVRAAAVTDTLLYTGPHWRHGLCYTFFCIFSSAAAAPDPHLGRGVRGNVQKLPLADPR